MKKMSFIVGLIAISFFSPAQKIQSTFINWLHSSELKNAAISLSVVDLSDGKTLLQTDPMMSVTPASILKVVTTATALEVFGPDSRFKTTLSVTGAIRNDTLYGDLQIVGGGDPTLGSSYFPETNSFETNWINALKENHIRVINGRVVADAGIYDRMIPGSWLWEDLGNYYGTGACGLSVYDNLYEVHLQSPATADQLTQIIGIQPEIPGLVLKNEVLSSDINRDQAYIFGNPEDQNRVIRGTIPKGHNDYVVKGSMPDPPAFLADEFTGKLAAEGIQVIGSVGSGKTNPAGKVIVETLSPPLSEIIRVTNHESVNLFAEHLLKHIAWQKTGFGTTNDGAQLVLDFWKEKGIDVGGLFLNDGSGLSRFDAVTAQTMTAILCYMKTRSAFINAFSQSLPSAGNGTLSFFGSEHFPGSSLNAKSGSMTRVRCYAGYLTTISGKQLAFAVLLNNFSCTQPEAIRKIEELLVELRKI